MNLEQLEAISAVAEKGSFRAAADHLRRSQPALSATIKNLEDEFDIQIFDRSEYRPKLTEAGTAFLEVARTTLNAAHYASRVGTELGKHKAETKLHVSLDPLASIEIIELLAQECARPVLPVNLILEKSILMGRFQDLIEGKIDLAFAPRPERSENIESIPLETIHLVSAVSRKLLQEKRKPTEAFLDAHPQILAYDKNVDQKSDQLLPQAALGKSGHKIYVPDHFTKLRLIEGGIGWGRISKTEFDAGEELVMIDKSICPPVIFELCILRAKNRPLGPVARAIWSAFKKKSNT